MGAWLMSPFIILVGQNKVYCFEVSPFFFSSEINKSGGGSTNELARKYFSELDIDTTKQLYELYKVDFEMFDYSPEEYFEISRNHSS